MSLIPLRAYRPNPALARTELRALLQVRTSRGCRPFYCAAFHPRAVQEMSVTKRRTACR